MNAGQRRISIFSARGLNAVGLIGTSCRSLLVDAIEIDVELRLVLRRALPTKNVPEVDTDRASQPGVKVIGPLRERVACDSLSTDTLRLTGPGNDPIRGGRVNVAGPAGGDIFLTPLIGTGNRRPNITALVYARGASRN